MELTYVIWLLVTLTPAFLFFCVLILDATRMRLVSKNGLHTFGRVIEIRTFKAVRTKSVCPIVEVSLPDGKVIAVRTGEQNIFTRYKVGQVVPVILHREDPLLKVYINTPTERFPPLLVFLAFGFALASLPALNKLAT